MDRQVGRLREGLKALGIERKTLLIFASDNGPLPTLDGRRSGGLRGSKLSLYEGGIRLPFVAVWPGTIPAGATDEATVFGAVDVFPTVCKLAGAALPARRAARRRGPLARAAGHAPARARQAALLGVRPERHLVRLPDRAERGPARGPLPQPRRPRRPLEAARERRRHRGRALRPVGRPGGGEGPRGDPAGAGGEAHQAGARMEEIAAMSLFILAASALFDRRPGPAAERPDRHDRRPGARRLLVHGQPGAEDAELRRLRPRGGAADRLPRRPDVQPHARAVAHRPGGPAQRGDLGHRGPDLPAARDPDAADCSPRRGTGPASSASGTSATTTRTARSTRGSRRASTTSAGASSSPRPSSTGR